MLAGNFGSSTWTGTMTFWLTYATKTQTLILSASKIPSEWEAEQWHQMGYQQRSLTPTECSTAGGIKLPMATDGLIWEHPENGDQIISLSLTVSPAFPPPVGIGPWYSQIPQQWAINDEFIKSQLMNNLHSSGGSQTQGIGSTLFASLI